MSPAAVGRWLGPRASAVLWTGAAALAPATALLLIIRTLSINERSLAAQSNALVASVAMAAVAGLALFGPKIVRTRRTTLAWVVALGGLLVVSAIVWQKLFMAHHLAGGTGHIYRPMFLSNLRSPFYGFPLRPVPFWAGSTALLSALMIVILHTRPLARFPLRSLVATALAFQMALTCALAFSESPERPLGMFSGYRAFSGYAAHFEGPLALLRDWTATMRRFSGFGNHYPPGISFLLNAGGAPNSIGLVKSAFVLAPALTVIPLLGLARELRLEERAQKLIALLFATSATLLIFPTLTPTPSLMLPGTVAVWMLVRGLEREPVRSGIAMGLAVAIFSFLSFAVYMIALPMACILLGSIAADRTKFRAGFLSVGSGLAAFAGFFLLLYLTTGFDMYACVNEGFRLTIVKLYVSAAGFALRNTGCLIAYLVSVGFPLAALSLLAIGRAISDASQSRRLRVFVCAIALGVLMGAWTGRTWLETERVWLFYTPLLAMLGGWELDRRVSIEGDAAARGVVVAALGFASLYGLLMRHHF